MCWINFLTARLLEHAPRAGSAHRAHVAASEPALASDPAPASHPAPAAAFWGVFSANPAPTGVLVWGVCLGPLCGRMGGCHWDIGTKVLLEHQCTAGAGERCCLHLSSRLHLLSIQLNKSD